MRQQSTLKRKNSIPKKCSRNIISGTGSGPSFLYSYFVHLLFLLHLHPKTQVLAFFTKKEYFRAKIDIVLTITLRGHDCMLCMWGVVFGKKVMSSKPANTLYNSYCTRAIGLLKESCNFKPAIFLYKCWQIFL